MGASASFEMKTKLDERLVEIANFAVRACSLPGEMALDTNTISTFPSQYSAICMIAINLMCNEAARNTPKIKDIASSDTTTMVDHEDTFGSIHQIVELSEDDFEDGVFNKTNHCGFFGSKDLFVKCEEGINTSDFSFIEHVEQTTGMKVMAIKIPNNDINTDSPLLQCLESRPHLQFLNIASNPLNDLADMITSFPRNLLVLDLSFCEDLCITANCFLAVPQLQSLSLEGCNISNTNVSDGDIRSSIFFGLVGLEELNVKDNALADLESCQGLKYFGMLQMNETAVSNEIASLSAFYARTNNDGHVVALVYQDRPLLEYKLEPTLRSLWIAENPACETSAAKAALKAMLATNVGSLQHMDGEWLPGRGKDHSGPIDVRTKLNRNIENFSGLVSGGTDGGGLDAMEKEYLSALKGENDTSVVA